MPSRLEGEIWLTADQPGSNFAMEQVSLLAAIHRTGSISAAARELGISYRTAWERLERMNNLSRQALVERTAGGSRGGGSQLTDHGQKIVQGFSRIQQQHHDYVEKLGARLDRFDDLARFVSSSRLISSAGNQFLGTVTHLQPGAVNAEVSLQVNEQVSLVAIVTEQSRASLAITKGKQLIALVKASSVLLTNQRELQVSARNIIHGQITRLDEGKVNTDVSIDIGDEKTLNAVITNRSASRMALREGSGITAFFKASSVILLGS